MIEPLLGRQFILHSTLYIQQSFKRKKKKKITYTLNWQICVKRSSLEVDIENRSPVAAGAY